MSTPRGGPRGVRARGGAPAREVLARRRELGERADLLDSHALGELHQQVRGGARVAERAVGGLARAAPAGAPARRACCPPIRRGRARARACRSPGSSAAAGARRAAGRSGTAGRTARCGTRAPARRTPRAAGARPRRASARPASIASVMPCTAEASGGMGRPTSTSEDQAASSRIAPSTTRTTATSTMAWPSAGERPVVSVSTTAIVVALQQRHDPLSGPRPRPCARTSRSPPRAPSPRRRRSAAAAGSGQAGCSRARSRDGCHRRAGRSWSGTRSPGNAVRAVGPE